MKKKEKKLGRAIVVLFTSALCFGFASCNFGDGDNNSTSDNPSQKKYGVVESFSSNNDYYLAGEKIKSTEYAISFYSNDGEPCTSLTHSDKLEIQIDETNNNNIFRIQEYNEDKLNKLCEEYAMKLSNKESNPEINKDIDEIEAYNNWKNNILSLCLFGGVTGLLYLLSLRKSK